MAAPPIFVKSGEEYVRVSTNVKKDDGSRANRNDLGSEGQGDCRDQRRQAFLRRVTILEKPYVTGYEPMRDAGGKVIGIYYVGYMK